MRFCVYFLAAALLLAPAPVAAQQHGRPADHRRLIISEKAIADALAAEQPSTRGQRDSLKNGTIIGAVIGAAIMGTGVMLLCTALKEPGDPSCWKSSGLAIAIGAGTGALGGAGIDALLSQRPLARFAPRRNEVESVGLP
jgi:hypothetical protein